MIERFEIPMPSDLLKQTEQPNKLESHPSCCGRPMDCQFGNSDGYFCQNCGDWKSR